MSTNTALVSPLNWPSLVQEAIRRRKAEKLTQKEHAALASVSVPTIVAFDRGECSLTLAKALDILRVVGLVDEPREDNSQEAFAREAFQRWRDLISKLPERSPGRMQHGWFRIDYALEGNLKSITLDKLRDLLSEAAVKNTGWPIFILMSRSELEPKEVDGTLECWMKPPEAGTRHFRAGPGECDFWRAAPEGRFFTIRGFQEDDAETFQPGTIFDITLPIWRLGEALLHASRVAALMKQDDDSIITIRFRVLYSGLSGRLLRAWASPLLGMTVEGTARSDEALLEIVATDTEIKNDLAKCVFPLVASLFERFGVTGLSPTLVQEEIRKFQNSRA